MALLVIGTAAFVLAFWLALARPDYLAVIVSFFVAGCAIIGIVAYRFYLEAVVPARKYSSLIKENAQLMDAVQDAALELTKIITQINDYALLNADKIVGAVEGARVALNFLPGGSKILELDYFKKSQNLAKGIRSVALSSREVVADVGDSIAKADAVRIIALVQELKKIRALIEKELLE